MAEFRECPTCTKKPGMAELCEVCVHNRELIDSIEGLQTTVRDQSVEIDNLEEALKYAYMSINAAMRNWETPTQ